MKIFESLLPSKNAKKKYSSNARILYFSHPEFNEKNAWDNISYLQQLNMENLQSLNVKKKRFNTDLIDLWANIEMKKFVEFIIGTTINPYESLQPLRETENYFFLLEESRIQNLLDIKFIKKVELANVVFNNIYIATYEIYDEKESVFRPYVELYVKNEFNSFSKIGFGYDSTNDKVVELFIDNFNYPVFLHSDGTIRLPLLGKVVKLNVYDYISNYDIGTITNISQE